MDDNQARFTEVPPSLPGNFEPNYLGNPDLVARLVGEFCVATEDALDGAHGEHFVDAMRGLIRYYADIFSGRNSEYQTIKGYNEVTLPQKLKVDLGEFWQSNRAAWGDDPVCVLFEWLVIKLAESLKRAQGDDMLLEVMLKPHIQGVVQRLLGIDARLMP